MSKLEARKRRIALFVEGDSERGDARRRTLPVFFHKWLDPQLPAQSKVGITPVKFQGVSDFLASVAERTELYLTNQRANFVVGLVDLYGLPPNRIDLTRHDTVQEKVTAARAYIKNLIPQQFRGRYRQHFAVHEVEAWLLAYPQCWPAHVRALIQKRPPEEVNFNEPPAKFLKRILGGKYKKTVHAKNLFPMIDPQVAIYKCPFLKSFAHDLLEISKRLQ